MSTPLTDERLERLRTSVLDAVDADVERRGRRTRRVLGGVAAACLVVVVGGVGLSALTSPGGDATTAADSASSAEPGVLAGRSADAGGAAEQEGAAPPAGSEAQDQDRDVVTTGSAVVTVDDPAAAAAALTTWVESQQGRVDQRSETGTDADDGATLTVRVPADRLEATLDRLRGLGDVTGLDVVRDDVTAQRVDLDARIRSLRISVERLEGLLDSSADTTDLLATEKALGERQGELESLESQRSALGEQVALSTLTVDLVPRERSERVDPGGFVGGLQSGWNALVSTVNRGVEVVGAVLPWAGAALLLALLWAGGRRVLRRR